LKYAGVVEGFYGPPWSSAERKDLFGKMQSWASVNTYLYAPKDDLKHRGQWRVLYTESECAELSDTIASARRRGIRFIYALAPGLDMRYTSKSDRLALEQKLGQLIGLGAEQFALLFDDIPERLHPEDQALFSSFAAAQNAAIEVTLAFLKSQNCESELLFCPTVYCDRQANFNVSENAYLKELACGLPAEVQVFWTGPEVVSPEITAADMLAITKVLGRAPILWDNLHASDYDMRRIFLGPYLGRSLDLRSALAGILTNPNGPYEVNFLPLASFAHFISATDKWEVLEDYGVQVENWHQQFEKDIPLDDLRLLCDCFYLPSVMGPRAQEVFKSLTVLSSSALDSKGLGVTGCHEKASTQGSSLSQLHGELVGKQKRLARMHERLAHLKKREIFYALHRFVWDAYSTLQHALDVLEAGEHASGKGAARPRRPEFLPKTAAGDFLRSLEYLKMGPEGLEPPT
jgi:hypothetical protein